MSFNSRLNFPYTKPPMRVYVHETWGNHQEAEDYINEVIRKHEKEFTKYGFILAALWRSPTSNNLDVLRFEFNIPNLGTWHGNPVISPLLIKNGLYDTQGIVLEDILIAFGEEMKHRRTKDTLDEYIGEWPLIGKLEPKLSIPITRNETSNFG